jgi:hypothetical protein
MALQDTIRNATRPIVAKLMGELGSRITIRHPAISRAADASSTRTWSDSGTAIPCKLRIVSTAHVQRVWGMTSDVVVEGMIPANLVQISDGDGVIVTDGFLAGKTYTIDHAILNDLGQYLLLGLVEPRGVIG